MQICCIDTQTQVFSRVPPPPPLLPRGGEKQLKTWRNRRQSHRKAQRTRTHSTRCGVVLYGRSISLETAIEMRWLANGLEKFALVVVLVDCGRTLGSAERWAMVVCAVCGFGNGGQTTSRVESVVCVLVCTTLAGRSDHSSALTRWLLV